MTQDNTQDKIFSFGEIFATCAIITVVSLFFGGFIGDAGANKNWENRMVQYDCCQYNPTTGDFEILKHEKIKIGLITNVTSIPVGKAK